MINKVVLVISKDPTGFHRTKILEMCNFSIFMVLFKQTEAGTLFANGCIFRENWIKKNQEISGNILEMSENRTGSLDHL